MDIEKELRKFSKEVIIKAAMMRNPFNAKELLGDVMRVELDLIIKKEKEILKKYKRIDRSNNTNKIFETMDYNRKLDKEYKKLNNKFKIIFKKLRGLNK